MKICTRHQRVGVCKYRHKGDMCDERKKDSDRLTGSLHGTGNDAEGNIEFTDLITDNPDGLSFQMACWHYIDGGPGVRSYVWERELMVVSDDCKACEDAWSHDGAYMISDLVTPTAEESERQSGIMGDVETYVKEMTLKYITGQESLDNWDEYCDYIWGLGLQDAVDIEQDVLDRYNAR